MALAPTAFDKPGASIPGLVAGQVDALGLMQRPTLNVPFASTGALQLLVAGMGILAGLVARDITSVATPLVYRTASSANPAAANNVTLVAGGPGITTWITGFEITGDGATAGSIITVTLTGMVGGTKTYFLTIPAGAGTAITPLIVSFPAPGLPASAFNTAITLNVPSFGAGNTNAAATINGYTQDIGSQSPGVNPASISRWDLLDGLDTNGERILPFGISPLGSIQLNLGPHGPVFTRGLALNPVGGSIVGAVWVKI